LIVWDTIFLSFAGFWKVELMKINLLNENVIKFLLREHCVMKIPPKKRFQRPPTHSIDNWTHQTTPRKKSTQFTKQIFSRKFSCNLLNEIQYKKKKRTRFRDSQVKESKEIFSEEYYFIFFVMLILMQLPFCMQISLRFAWFLRLVWS
jgi:hypothetical protein